MRTELQQRVHKRTRGPAWKAAIAAFALVAGGVAASPLASAAPVQVGGRTFDVISAPVGQEHYQAAYSARHNWLWVTATTHNWDSGTPRADVSTISKVNPANLQVISQITPRTLDSGTANARSEAAYGIAVDDENDRIWTSATREDAVVVYNQTTGARVATIGDVGHSRDIAIDPFRNIAYVSDPNGGSITKISTETLRVVDTIRLGGNFSPMSLDLVVDANTALLYTVNLNDGALIELNSLTSNARVVAQTGGQRASGVAVDRGRGLAYVASQDSQDVRTVNLATGQVTNTVRGAQAMLNVAVDSEAGLVYGATFGGSSVLVLDADNGNRIGEVAVGNAPNDVIVANGAAYALDRQVGSRVWKITPQATNPTPTPTPTTSPTSSPTTPGQATATVEGTPTIGGTITLKGTGWKHPDGTGSKIAVKLDDGNIRTPAGADVWQTIDANNDGTFTAQIKLPNGTTGAGGSNPAYTTGAHVIRLLTGSLKPGDTGRSIKVDITVGAAQPTTSPTATPTTSPTATPTTSPTATPTTSPTSSPTTKPTTPPAPDGATVTVKGKPSVGGKLFLTGKGWKTADGKAGSKIAVKIDDGAVKKTDGTDVWAIIEAKADGTFKAEVKLPNGSTRGEYGSNPAFKKGAHSVRLLTGALAENDVRRSVKVDIKVGKALPKPAPTTAPSISGKAQGHATLTANAGKWRNAKGATFSYQWLRDGKAIKGATSKKYELTGADTSKRVSVRVEATTSNGAWGAAVSASERVEKANTILTAKVASRQGSEKPASIRVEIGSRDWIKPNGGTLTITAGNKAPVKVKANDYYVTAELPWLRPGMTHKVTVAFSGDSTLKGSSTSIEVRVRG